MNTTTEIDIRKASESAPDDQSYRATPWFVWVVLLLVLLLIILIILLFLAIQDPSFKNHTPHKFAIPNDIETKQTLFSVTEPFMLPPSQLQPLQYEFYPTIHRIKRSAPESSMVVIGQHFAKSKLEVFVSKDSKQFDSIPLSAVQVISSDRIRISHSESKFWKAIRLVNPDSQSCCHDFEQRQGYWTFTTLPSIIPLASNSVSLKVIHRETTTTTIASHGAAEPSLPATLKVKLLIQRLPSATVEQVTEHSMQDGVLVMEDCFIPKKLGKGKYRLLCQSLPENHSFIECTSSVLHIV